MSSIDSVVLARSDRRRRTSTPTSTANMSRPPAIPTSPSRCPGGRNEISSSALSVPGGSDRSVHCVWSYQFHLGMSAIPAKARTIPASNNDWSASNAAEMINAATTGPLTGVLRSSSRVRWFRLAGSMDT